MKRQTTPQPRTEGVRYVKNIVTAQGSIFHPIHPETNLLIDGYIELFHAGKTTGKLIALQVQSDGANLTQDGSEFVVEVELPPLEHISRHLVPIILIYYSPSLQSAAWIAIQPDDQPHETESDETPLTPIHIPLSNSLTPKSLDNELAVIANLSPDQTRLIPCIDKCLNADVDHRLETLTFLNAHPGSRNSRIFLLVCRSLLFDEDPDLADEAIRILARHAGRFRWSWNPENQTEIALMRYAAQLCRNLTADECRTLVERVDDESFGHSDAMGEQVFDLLVRCEQSQKVLEQIAADKQQPLPRRCNALFMTYCCNNEKLLADPDLANDPDIGEVYQAMNADESGLDE